MKFNSSPIPQKVAGRPRCHQVPKERFTGRRTPVNATKSQSERPGTLVRGCARDSSFQKVCSSHFPLVRRCKGAPGKATPSGTRGYTFLHSALPTPLGPGRVQARSPSPPCPGLPPARPGVGDEPGGRVLGAAANPARTQGPGTRRGPPRASLHLTSPRERATQGLQLRRSVGARGARRTRRPHPHIRTQAAVPTAPASTRRRPRPPEPRAGRDIKGSDSDPRPSWARGEPGSGATPASWA